MFPQVLPTIPKGGKEDFCRKCLLPHARRSHCPDCQSIPQTTSPCLSCSFYKMWVTQTPTWEGLCEMAGIQCPALCLQWWLGRASVACCCAQTGRGGTAPALGALQRHERKGERNPLADTPAPQGQEHRQTGSLTRGGAPSVGVSKREESSCGRADKWGDSSGKDVPRRGSPDKGISRDGVPRYGGLQMNESPGMGGS